MTQTEYEQLLKRKIKARLAKWVRDTCLEREPSRKAKQVQKIDPALFMVLARIGGNLNQIVRNLNLDKNMALNKKLII